MKKFQLVILTTLLTSLLFTSCSKDDDEAPQPEPSLEEVKFALINGFEKIILPQGLLNEEEDGHARIALRRIDYTKKYRSYYTTYLTIPEDAETSNTPITPGEGEYLVYQWKNDKQETIFCQVSQQENNYLLEVFIQGENDAHLKLFEAYQAKDSKKLQINLLESVADLEEGTTTWEEKNGSIHFAFEYEEVKFEQVLHPDGSGKQTLFKNNKPSNIIQWDAQGNGTWTEFEEDGTTVNDSGSWSKK
ncbi:hypothetical protein AAG747_14330 [Rapidithrix thailandica]|uniref:Lipoprotein n=1 Tax=Rapidithrix thailandica TaxID=413964 RepID=A0AAW9SEG8_9BACT